MPLDPSISLKAGNGVAQNPLLSNPLAAIGQFAQTQNALNQNRLFPLQQQSAQIGVQQQQAALSGAQLQQHLTRLNYNQGLMTPLLVNPDGTPTTGVGAKDIARAIATASGDGIMTAGDGAGLLSTLPNGGADPAANRQWVIQHYGANMAAQGQLQTALTTLTGAPGTMSNGQQNQPGQIAGPLSATPGAFTPGGGPTQVYPSRADLLAPQPGVGPNGQPVSVPMATRAAQVGRPDLAGPAGVPGGGAPPSAANPPRLAPPIAPPGTAVPTDLSPAARAASAVTGQGNAQQAQSLQIAAAGVPAQKALLGNLESTVNQITTGPGADWRNVAKAFTNTNNPFMFNVFNPSTIASQEEFGKQAFQLAQSQFQTLGGTGTDAKLNSIMHTSPSTMLSNLGNQGIIHLLKGNADAISAMNDEWQNKWLPAHGNDASTYGQFVTQFNKGYDPRVFQSAYMDPTQRAQMLSGMSAAEKTAFQQKYNAAVDGGWIPDPRQPAPDATPQAAPSGAPVVPVQ